MDERRRQALSALGEHSLEEALDLLVEAGVLDEEMLDARRSEQIKRWRAQATDVLGDELAALRREARQQRRRAREQAHEPGRQREANVAARDEVVRLDERRREMNRQRAARHQDLAAAAASLEAAHRALGGALAAMALLEDGRLVQNEEPGVLPLDGDAQLAPRPTGLQLREQRVGHRLCVEAAGEIDIATAPALRRALAAAADSGASDLWVDLTGVRFMDSTGISALLAARGELRSNRRLALICPPGAVRRTLALAGVDRLFEIFEDRASAHVAG